MQNTNKKRKSKLLSFKIILEATKGEPLAMEKVIEHFKGYMITLSTRKLEDEYGNTYSLKSRRIIHRFMTKSAQINSLFQTYCKNEQ